MTNAARIFKALSDETRLRILLLLLSGELCVCEVMGVLDLPQSTASRHLAYLRNAGWVLDRRQGVWMYYRLNDDGQPLRKELRRVIEACLAASEEARQNLTRLAEFRRQAC
jgi:ArsR family transcriptional regulator, arsenate/arsenite/antimonite-responsive transcriptional repressor